MISELTKRGRKFDGPSHDLRVAKDYRSSCGMNLGVSPGANDDLRADAGGVAHGDGQEGSVLRKHTELDGGSWGEVSN